MSKAKRKKASKRSTTKPEFLGIGIPAIDFESETTTTTTTTTTAERERSGPGYPHNYQTVEWVGIACPRCGSTEREPFKGRTTTLNVSKAFHKYYGIFYNQVVFRPTACCNCGQRLMSKEFRFIGEDESSDLDS